MATLPAERVALEILEGQVIDETLVDAVAALVAKGYRFALDDFTYSEDAIPLLELVEVVKLDLEALGRDGNGSRHVELLSGYDVELLAEKVETPEDHAFCVALGCHRFQGYFYRKPELLTGRRIEGGPGAVAAASARRPPGSGARPARDRAPDQSRRRGSALRLLRYINSAFVGLRHEVASIGQAVALLGAVNLRRWATLSLFAGMDNKPSELTRTALVRARFCELAQPTCDGDVDGAHLFTLGLFSVIDALMDSPIDEAIRPIPFPQEIRRALIDRGGPLGAVLCRRSSTSRTGRSCGPRSSSPAALPSTSRAIDWADEASRQLFPEAVPEAV